MSLNRSVPSLPAETITGPAKRAAYSDLFDRMVDPVFLLDPATYVVLQANAACERIFGVGEEKFKGRCLLEFLTTPSEEDLRKAFRVAMRRYHPRQFESQWSVSDSQAGEPRAFVMEVSACPLKLSDDGEVLQVTARDISFRRESEIQMQQLFTQLQEANTRLERMATVDEMTGLFNFRHFKNEITTELTRSVRFQQPFAVLFTDIDNFKHFNDRNGHPAGDALLRHLAQVFQRTCRELDVVARYGGEEYVILCPNTTADQGMILADRLLKNIAATRFLQGESQPLGEISVSLGVASYPENGSTVEEVLKAADQAMYYAKTHGKKQAITTARAIELEKLAA